MRYYSVIVKIGSKERVVLIKAITLWEAQRFTSKWKAPVMSITEVLTTQTMITAIKGEL